MSLLAKIIAQEPVAAVVIPAVARATFDPPPITAIATTAALTTPALAEPDRNLPPAIPCLICSCPAIWSTIYEPGAFRCCDCEPPPGGWHAKTGGWQFVHSRLALETTRDDRLLWADFPRDDHVGRRFVVVDERGGVVESFYGETAVQPAKRSSVRPVSRAAIRERARAAASSVIGDTTTLADEIAF